MKISADQSHPDYHPVAYYCEVFIESGRTQLKSCISLDTITGEYTCYKLTMEIQNGEAVTYTDKDETLYIEFMEDTPRELIDDWYAREYKETT
jgi:uncharacterized protein YbaA (DUF1428 family)